jgi:hypothetical protein
MMGDARYGGVIRGWVNILGRNCGTGMKFWYVVREVDWGWSAHI